MKNKELIKSLAKAVQADSHAAVLVMAAVMTMTLEKMLTEQGLDPNKDIVLDVDGGRKITVHSNSKD